MTFGMRAASARASRSAASASVGRPARSAARAWASWTSMGSCSSDSVRERAQSSVQRSAPASSTDELHHLDEDPVGDGQPRRRPPIRLAHLARARRARRL